jgi:hypothetical protein
MASDYLERLKNQDDFGSMLIIMRSRKTSCKSGKFWISPMFWISKS